MAIKVLPVGVFTDFTGNREFYPRSGYYVSPFSLRIINDATTALSSAAL